MSRDLLTSITKDLIEENKQLRNTVLMLHDRWESLRQKLKNYSIGDLTSIDKNDVLEWMEKLEK